MLPLHPDLSVDALAGEPRVNREIRDPPVVDLQEVTEELRVGGFELVEVHRADLPDRRLQPRVGLVHVLHRCLNGDAAAAELLEHERVLRAGVQLPLVHEVGEERRALVEEASAEHARRAHLCEHRCAVRPQFAEVEGDDERLTGLYGEREVATCPEEPPHARRRQKAPHLGGRVLLAGGLEAMRYIRGCYVAAALEQGDGRFLDRLRELRAPRDAVDLAQDREELRRELLDLAFGARDLVKDVVRRRTL